MYIHTCVIVAALRARERETDCVLARDCRGGAAGANASALPTAQ